MAFTPLSAHFELKPQTVPPVIEYKIPGYTGIVAKNVTPNPPVIIIQTGKCLPASMSDLMANRGDATTTVTLNARNCGSFNNCYKYDAKSLGVQASNLRGATPGLVEYWIEWHQISP